MPVDLDSLRLRREVQDMYARVAESPDGGYHFHRGLAYAASLLGYDAAELAALPASVTHSFAGVGNPHAIAPLAVRARVLDIGSGAGTDLLLAALRVGPVGHAIGVDMTAEMRDRARAGARECGLTHVERPRRRCPRTCPSTTTRSTSSISNGMLNLVPEKERSLRRDRARAEAGRPASGSRTSSPASNCRTPSGATSTCGPVELPALCRRQSSSARSRRRDSPTVQITASVRVLQGTTKERTAQKYGVVGVNVSGVRS
jgi:hypothetical protein